MSDKTKVQEAHIQIASRCRGNHIEDLMRCETCDPLHATLDAAVKEATLAGFNSADDVVRAELVARAEAAERERDKQALSAGE